MHARTKTSSRERARQGQGTKLRRGWEPGNESGNFGIFLGNLVIFWELTWDFYKITVGNSADWVLHFQFETNHTNKPLKLIILNYYNKLKIAQVV